MVIVHAVAWAFLIVSWVFGDTLIAVGRYHAFCLVQQGRRKLVRVGNVIKHDKNEKNTITNDTAHGK